MTKVKFLNSFFLTIVLLLFTYTSYAGCPLDHIKIGCNPDGDVNTIDDNNDMFFEVEQLYRHTNPEDIEEDVWLNWYYPLPAFIAPPWHSNGEPGFGQMWSLQGETIINEEHMLKGERNVDYQLVVEVVAIGPNDSSFYAQGGYPTPPGGTFSLSQPGDTFVLSHFETHHAHMTYWADSNEMHWITYRIYDAFYDAGSDTGYRPTDTVTVVFGKNPLAGDIYVDEKVDMKDLAHLSKFWLSRDESSPFNPNGDARYDYFDRADINRDYSVDFLDFALLASNWPESPD